MTLSELAGTRQRDACSGRAAPTTWRRSSTRRGPPASPRARCSPTRNELVNAAHGRGAGAARRRASGSGMLLPLFHANAQVVTTLIPMMIGCEVVMWERFSRLRSSGRPSRSSSRSTISAVPDDPRRGAERAGRARAAATSLRYVICGAAPLSRRAARGVPGPLRDPHPRGLRADRDDLHLVDQPVLRRAQGRLDRPPGARAADADRRPRTAKSPTPASYGEIVIKGPNVMAGLPERTTRPPPSRSATAGCTPATSATSTRTATSSSSTAPRT